MSNPPPLTLSMRRKINRFLYYFHIGKGGRCTPPRVSPSDRLCHFLGFLDCKTLRRVRSYSI